ncbi:Outer membrane protein assembly factor BamB [Rhodocyclaceae bacterium]|nr:Outer membrane protein assembly factor BamB [Rhodocyclaceae bacterium]
MTFRTPAIAALLIVLLAGCSTFLDNISGTKPKVPAKLVEFKQTATLQLRWSSDIGKSGSNALQPAVMGGAVYAANAKGDVFRLEGTTGKQVWRANAGFAVTAGVGTGDGLVLAGGEKGDLAAFEEDGKLRWKVKVSSEILSAPRVANGIVVVRTGDGRIAGLSALDGRRQWLYERATPSLIVRSHGGVSIANGTVYAGFAAGKLAAIGLNNGIVIWEAAVSQPRGNTELERISDITSAPVVDDDQVCAVAFQGRAACFDLKRGSLLWSRELSSDKGMALQGKYLYVTDANGVVSALDKSSGSSLWKNDQLSLRSVSAPYVPGKHVVVGDFEGYLHALGIEDGSLAARIRADSSAILAAPVELDGGVLVQTSGGGLYSVAIH